MLKGGKQFFMENPGEPWPRPALFTETLSCPCKSGCPRHRSPSAGKALAPSQARESTGNRAAATEMGSQRGRALPSFQRPGPTCSVLPSLPPAETSRDTAETLHRGEKKARCSFFFFPPKKFAVQQSRGGGGRGDTKSGKHLWRDRNEGIQMPPPALACVFEAQGRFHKDPTPAGKRASHSPLLNTFPAQRARAGAGAGAPTARLPQAPARPPPQVPAQPRRLTAHARAARACAEPTGALRGR